MGSESKRKLPAGIAGLWATKEVAKYLKVDVDTVQYLVRGGFLRARRRYPGLTSGKWYFERTEVEQFAAKVGTKNKTK